MMGACVHCGSKRSERIQGPWFVHCIDARSCERRENKGIKYIVDDGGRLMCHFKLKMGKERIIEVPGILLWYDKDTPQLRTEVGTWTPPDVPVKKILREKESVDVIATVKLYPKPWGDDRECNHWHLLQSVRPL